MPKLTKQFVELEIQLPIKGQRFVRDDDIPGFAVRVTPKSKSYILEKRVDGITKRITIGRCTELSLESARNQACIMLADIAKGNDPKTGKRINTLSDITLREVLQKFLEIKPIRKDTNRNYHFAINKHFKDWLDMPITSITKDMVEERHHYLTISPNRLKTSGHGRANNALKKLSALINFASDRYGTDDEPLIKSNPVSRLSRNRSWHRIHPRQGIVPDHKLKDWYRAVGTLQNEVARDFMVFLLLTGMRCGETRRLRWCHVDFENKLLVVPRELTKSDREHRLPLEKLDLPYYTLKRLVNHNVSNGMTGRYRVLDMERLRAYMSLITNAFLELLDINGSDMREWKPVTKTELNESTQLLIPLDHIRIL